MLFLKWLQMTSEKKIPVMHFVDRNMGCGVNLELKVRRIGKWSDPIGLGNPPLRFTN